MQLYQLPFCCSQFWLQLVEHTEWQVIHQYPALHPLVQYALPSQKLLRQSGLHLYTCKFIFYFRCTRIWPCIFKGKKYCLFYFIFWGSKMSMLTDIFKDIFSDFWEVPGIHLSFLSLVSHQCLLFSIGIINFNIFLFPKVFVSFRYFGLPRSDVTSQLEHKLVQQLTFTTFPTGVSFQTTM